MTLTFSGSIDLPAHGAGGFDHGDVHPRTGRVFLAHTANGTVEVLDGLALRLDRTLQGCAEGSGILFAPGEPELIFAAARGDGAVLAIDARTCEALGRFSVGPRPNGLAWDQDRRELLVADVETFDARLMDPDTGACRVIHPLPGRPRWCVYDQPRQRFLVNIREPACVVALAAGTLAEVARIDGLPAGPHGLDLDRPGNRAFVACDEGLVCALDLNSDRVVGRTPIAGEPDAIWYSSATEALYVAVGTPGGIDVVDGRSLSVVQQVPTEEGAHTTAFDAQRGRFYVFLPRRCEAAVYEEKR